MEKPDQAKSAKEVRYLVVTNKRSGVESTIAHDVADGISLLRSRGIHVIERAIQEIGDKDHFIEYCRQHAIQTVVSAGGDGTVHTLVNMLCGTDIRLAVVPGGTFNHFAKHIGMPKNIVDAFAIIESCESRYIDVALINDRACINFASVGFYTQVIQRRVEYQKRGWKKFKAFIPALAVQLWRYKRYRFSLGTQQKTIVKKTPLIFIGNNEFYFGGQDILFDRESFVSGKLHISYMRKASRFELIKVAWGLMFGKRKLEAALQSVLLDTVTLSSSRDTVSVAIDGEIVRMKTPLQCKVLPRSLRVAVPIHEVKNIESLYAQTKRI